MSAARPRAAAVTRAHRQDCPCALCEPHVPSRPRGMSAGTMMIAGMLALLGLIASAGLPLGTLVGGLG